MYIQSIYYNKYFVLQIYYMVYNYPFVELDYNKTKWKFPGVAIYNKC